MSTSTWTSSISARLTGSGSAGLLYGAIVTAAVLVTAGGHDSSTTRVVVSWGFVLITYWLTHVYVHAAEGLVDGDERSLTRRCTSAARAEVGVLIGGVPGIVVFVGASWSAADVLTAERFALYVTVVLLAGFGYVGARQAGRSAVASYQEATGAAVLGLLMVAAKALLH